VTGRQEVEVKRRVNGEGAIIKFGSKLRVAGSVGSDSLLKESEGVFSSRDG
jgi:hypothetical protein